MAGFSSLDDFINKTSVLGYRYRSDWTKNFLPTTAAVAGEWHNLWRGAGYPGADSIGNTGTNLAWQQLTDTTTNSTSILHGGNVTPYYKHLLAANAFTAAATTAPCILKLVDFLGFYRVTSVTTTGDQATTNTLVNLCNFTADASTDIITHTYIGLENYSKIQVATTTTLPGGLSASTNYYTIKVTDLTCKLATSLANAQAGTAIDITSAGTGTHNINTLLPRYTSGAGVQCLWYNNNATALGAATPNCRITYTDQSDNSGNVTPSTLPVGKTAAANGLIVYSGTGVGKYGPNMPLAAGDSGIRSIEQINLSASYVSGEFSVLLYKSICDLPITTLGIACERDFLQQIPSLPRIYDGACLNLLMYSGAATPVNSALFGALEFGFG